MFWLVVIRTILIIYTIILFVSPGYGMSLEEAVSVALDNNPKLLAARSAWKAAEAKTTVVSTWDDPQLDLMYEKIPQGGGTLKDVNMKMYGLSQKIPFPGKLTLKRQAAEKAASQAEQNFKTKSNQIIAKVKSAYYKLLFVDRSIEVVRENQGLLKKFARIAEAKYIVGKAIQHDVIKAKIEHSLLANELITLKQQRESVQAKLNMLLDREPDVLITLDMERDIPDASNIPTELEKIALENRPDLKAKGYALAKSKKEHTLSRMEFLPNFKLKVLRRERRSTGLDGWNVGIELPLWFWKETAGINASSRKIEAAGAELKSLKNKIRFEVKDVLVKVDAARRLTALYQKEIVPQAKQALRSATVAYEADRIDILTLISSQKTLEEAKLGYFKALTGLGRSLAELERIIGVQLKEVKS
jgi:outer membrane protein TolC